MGWRELKAEIDAENKRFVDEAPDEVVKVVRFRIQHSGAGTDGQIMGTWFYTLTDVRFLTAYLYQIISAGMDPAFTADQLKYMVKQMMSGAGAYVGYSGFASLWRFIKGVIDTMDKIEDRDELLQLLSSLHLYASHLNAHIHYYYPWCISLNYPHRTAEHVREMAELIAAS
jgi:hypothetical protein